MADEMYAVNSSIITSLADSVRTSKKTDFRYTIQDIVSEVSDILGHITVVGTATGKVSTAGSYGEITLPVDAGPSAYVAIPITRSDANKNPKFIVVSSNYTYSGIRVGLYLQGVSGMSNTNFRVADISNDTITFVGTTAHVFLGSPEYLILRIH